MYGPCHATHRKSVLYKWTEQADTKKILSYLPNIYIYIFISFELVEGYRWQWEHFNRTPPLPHGNMADRNWPYPIFGNSNKNSSHFTNFWWPTHPGHPRQRAGLTTLGMTLCWVVWAPPSLDLGHSHYGARY